MMKRTLAICALLLGLVLLPIIKYGRTVHPPVPQYNENISEIQQLYKSVVWIGDTWGEWIGTGFIIGSDEKYSYIVTCAHVINTVNKHSGNSEQVLVGIWDQKETWTEKEPWTVVGGDILGKRGGAFSDDGDCAVVRIMKVKIMPLKLANPTYLVNVRDEIWTGGMINKIGSLVPIGPTVVTIGNVTEILNIPANSFIIDNWTYPGFSGGPVYSHKTKRVVGITAWGTSPVITICPDTTSIRELLATLKLDNLVKE